MSSSVAVSLAPFVHLRQLFFFGPSICIADVIGGLMA